MNKPVIRTTLAMPADVYSQIDAISRDRGVTRNAVIRDAIGHYLTRNDGSASLSRIATTTEFTQAAVDVLLRHQAPETRDEILLTVEQRMGMFHGQK